MAPDSPHSGLKVWFASCALTAIKKGDAGTLNVLLDRVIGRSTYEVRLRPAQSDEPEAPKLMEHMSDDEIEAEYRRLADKGL